MYALHKQHIWCTAAVGWGGGARVRDMLGLVCPRQGLQVQDRLHMGLVLFDWCLQQ
jgi:hypothetical protein